MTTLFKSRTEYAKKLLDPRWQQMRLRVFDRDGWKCRSCGAAAKSLHAHHAAYHPFSEGPWDYDDACIVTLCSECHSDEHEAIKGAQAAVLLALAKRGIWSTFELECLVDRIDDGGVV